MVPYINSLILCIEGLFIIYQKALDQGLTCGTFFDFRFACERSSTEGVTIGRNLSPPVEVSRFRANGRLDGDCIGGRGRSV